MDRTTILAAVDLWTVEDRLQLIDALYDRLTVDGSLPATNDPIWGEIDRRRQVHQVDPASALSRDQLEARLRSAQ